MLARTLKEMMTMYDMTKDSTVRDKCVNPEEIRKIITMLNYVDKNHAKICKMLYLICWVRFECQTREIARPVWISTPGSTYDYRNDTWECIFKTRMFERYHKDRSSPSVLIYPILDYAFELRDIFSY